MHFVQRRQEEFLSSQFSFKVFINFFLKDHHLSLAFSECLPSTKVFLFWAENDDLNLFD